MLPDGQAAVLTRRFQDRLSTVATRAAAVTTAQFAAMDRYDAEDVPAFVERVTPGLTAAKAAAVTTGVGYYSLLLQVRPPSVRPTDITVRDETREPFIAFWRALNAGRGPDEARVAGAARAEAIARNLTVSSARRTGDVVVERTGLQVAGWRRSVNAGACEWCRSVAGRVHRTAEAADYGHDRCGCSPTPLID